MSAGFVPADAATWSRDRQKIAGPWPLALAILDLRYWADPLACGHQARPGYRELAATWGWSLGRVGRFVSDRDLWIDPWRERIAAGTQVERERNSSGTTDPGAKPTTDDQRDTGGTAAEQDRNATETALRDPHARSTDTDTDTDTEQDPPGAGGTAAARATLELEICGRLWAHWRSLRRPGVGEKPGRLWHTGKIFDDDDRAKLRRQLQKRAKAHRSNGLRYPAGLQAAESDCRELIECFHSSPSCAHWQGANGRSTVYLGLGTLFQSDKMGSRWEIMGAWIQADRPLITGSDPAGANGHKAEADKAWQWLLKQVSQHGRGLPSTLREDDPAKERAVRAGIAAAGGVGALMGRAEQVRRLRFPFVEGYVESRQLETTT